MTLSAALTSPPALGAALPDSRGTDFWLAFPTNYGGGAELSLFIAGETATNGTVEVAGLSSQTFSVTPGSVTTVTLPSAAMLTASDGIENLGIHVTAESEVSVYGLNRVQYTTDAHLGLPTDILGTDYVVMGWGNVNVVAGSGMAIVGTQDSTTVSVSPSVTVGGHPAGSAYNVTLNQGQTYQLRAFETGADLTGTQVTSDKPVAVYGSHDCANVPNGGTVACDHVEEQLPPTSTWGKSFVTEPLATRIGGDTFRVLAGQDNTKIQINGTEVATLDRGEFHQQLIDGGSVITADNPVLVAQYSNGSSFDGVLSDPFMMLVPPYEQFLGSYTVSTPATGFSSNYINVVVPNAAVGQVKLDGVAVPAASFAAIGSSGFSGAQLAVALGSHNLDGPLPFGVSVYGFDSYDSYGYPGGLSLAPVAQVTSVALSPEIAVNPVGTEDCTVALVTDQYSSPLVGVRVDFTAAGVNSASGFANTDSTGSAEFCYTGTNVGSDTVTGTVGTISDTASRTWTSAGATPTATTYTGGSSVQYSDPISLSGKLTTQGGTPIAGRQLDFTLGTQTTAGAPTDANGDVTAPPLKVMQTPGSATSVTAAFAGDSDYGASSETKPFSITKEDCTLTYSGDTLVTAPSSTVLSADLGEPDSSPGDLSGKSVTFTVTGVATGVQTVNATTDSSGRASTTQPLAADVYAVRVSFGGDAYYESCATAQDALVTVQAGAAKVTGGGWISANGRSNFGLNAMPAAGGLFKGQFQLRAKSGKDRFHGDVVTTLNSAGNTATWTGTGRWNGTAGYSYTVSVVDNGSSGSRRGDTISVTIKSPSNVTVYTTSGAQTLKGGNITIH